jgi:hypothetical protein
VRILQGQSPYAPGTLIVWRAQSISSDCARRAHKIILLKSALPHICPLLATISDHLWMKIAKNCWKYVFLMFASISYNSTHKWVNKRCWANKWYYLWWPLPSRTYIVTPRQSRIAKGIHGLLKVSPGSTMPDPSMPCGRATLKWPYSHLWGGSSAGQTACSRLLPTWTDHTVRGFPTVHWSHSSVYGHMARSIHGLPKVFLGPAMPYPSTPCGQANSKTA